MGSLAQTTPCIASSPTLPSPAPLSMFPSPLTTPSHDLASGVASSSRIPAHAAASPSTSPTPHMKRLRSCLSPTRTPTGGMTPNRPGSASRATSFSSDCSADDSWRGAPKSVRWEGEDDGCVTSYHDTYSATEYDRTPLAPPSEQERTCVLPERGSRCISTIYDCFTSPLHLVDDLAGDDDAAVDAEACLQTLGECSTSFRPGYFPASPSPIAEDSPFFDTSTSDTSVDGDDNADVDGDGDADADAETREWEECMERRRMMFAQRNRAPAERDCQPEFEGYRSISSRLVDMLRDIESRRPASPPADELEVMSVKTTAGFTFTNLQGLRIGEEDEDAEEATDIDENDDNELSTPSLISSSGSEMEHSAIISPRLSLSPVIPGLPNVKGSSTLVMGATSMDVVVRS